MGAYQKFVNLLVLTVLVLPTDALAGGLGISCSYSIRQEEIGVYEFKLTLNNTWTGTPRIEHPANRLAIAFAIFDDHGNISKPHGVAKVDPRKQTLTLAPGETFDWALSFAAKDAFPFITGTGQFAYELDPNRCYRVVVVYRPLGASHDGYICSGDMWGEKQFNCAHNQSAGTQASPQSE